MSDSAKEPNGRKAGRKAGRGLRVAGRGKFGNRTYEQRIELVQEAYLQLKCDILENPQNDIESEVLSVIEASWIPSKMDAFVVDRWNPDQVGIWGPGIRLGLRIAHLLEKT